MSNITAKSILEMNNGAFMERADVEVAKIINNILDANTSPTAKRKMTLNFVFMPDADRQGIVVDLEVSSKLSSMVPRWTSLYVTADGSSGELQVVEMVPQIPGQMELGGGEQSQPVQLKLIV